MVDILTEDCISIPLHILSVKGQHDFSIAIIMAVLSAKIL